MSIPLIVDNTTFQYPTAGDEPGWGEAASGFAQAVANVLVDLKTNDDILQSAALISNNTSGIISGLVFNITTVRSAKVEYTLYRTTGSTEKLEAGTIVITRRDIAGDWLVEQDFVGDSGVALTVNNSGQFSYASDNYVGQTSGILKFRATALQKT